MFNPILGSFQYPYIPTSYTGYSNPSIYAGYPNPSIFPLIQPVSEDQTKQSILQTATMLLNTSPFNQTQSSYPDLSHKKVVRYQESSLEGEKKSTIVTQNKSKKKQIKNSCNWTPIEDDLLIYAVKKTGKFTGTKVTWKKIADLVLDRSANQCRLRYEKLLCKNIVHGRWAPEEDELLETAVKKFGENWRQVAYFVGSRDRKQCEDRWARKLYESQKNEPQDCKEKNAYINELKKQKKIPSLSKSKRSKRKNGPIENYLPQKSRKISSHHLNTSFSTTSFASFPPNSTFASSDTQEHDTLSPMPLLPPSTPLSPTLPSMTPLCPDYLSFSFTKVPMSETQDNSLFFTRKIQSPLLTDQPLSPLSSTEEDFKEENLHEFLE